MVFTVLFDAWAAMMWRACWQGSLVVLAVWSICRLLPSMPARFQCWFWRLAVLKFMIVLLLPSLLDLPLLPAPPARSHAEARSSGRHGNASPPNGSRCLQSRQGDRTAKSSSSLVFCLDHRRRLVLGLPAGRLASGKTTAKAKPRYRLPAVDRTTDDPRETVWLANSAETAGGRRWRQPHAHRVSSARSS